MRNQTKSTYQSVLTAMEEGDPAKKASEMKTYTDTVQKMIRCMDQTHFGNTLIGLMELNHVSEYQLCKQSGISTKTIQRMRQSESCISEKHTIIALCIGMKLPPLVSRCFLQIAGKPLGFSQEDLAYDLILNTVFLKGMDACTALLTEFGFQSI